MHSAVPGSDEECPLGCGTALLGNSRFLGKKIIAIVHTSNESFALWKCIRACIRHLALNDNLPINETLVDVGRSDAEICDKASCLKVQNATVKQHAPLFNLVVVVTTRPVQCHPKPVLDKDPNLLYANLDAPSSYWRFRVELQLTQLNLQVNRNGSAIDRVAFRRAMFALMASWAQRINFDDDTIHFKKMGKHEQKLVIQRPVVAVGIIVVSIAFVLLLAASITVLAFWLYRRSKAQRHADREYQKRLNQKANQERSALIIAELSDEMNHVTAAEETLELAEDPTPPSETDRNAAYQAEPAVSNGN
ncbi:hypothetical protein AAVH_04931 [Aphelenchoides avenae]|nr:hypothetical protein AAVH_04931 [Aphelenchus avenae]